MADESLAAHSAHRDHSVRAIVISAGGVIRGRSEATF